MADKVSKTSELTDIALSLLSDADGVTEPATEDGDSPAEGSVDDLTTDDLNDDQGQETGDADGDITEEGDADQDDADSEDEDDDDATGEADYIDINDDDVIDVMIDGKLEQRTIAELKKAVSGEGAIEKRLQEATELRKTAHAERTTALEKLADNERLIASSLTALNDTLFKAVIPPPDAAMKTSNPAVYLRHQEAYNEDQARITASKKAVQDKMEELAATRADRLKAYGDEAAKQIAKLIPALVDPKTSSKTLEALVSTAKTYGYSEQEIGAALDPRMFHLVHDAMQYRNMTSRAKELKVGDLSSQGKKLSRRLRSGNTRSAALVAANAKQQAAAKVTAAKTGKVKDVAAMIVANAPKKGK